VNGLVEVGTYVRDLRAGLDRLIENALDWEHLPHLHGGSFSAIRVIEHDDAGWRAEVRLVDGTAIILELRLEGTGWTTRSFAGDRLLSEIRSEAEATGPDACRVRVTFLLAGAPADQASALAHGYAQLYARLYDEDERMMIARAEALGRGPAALRERRLVTLPGGTPTTAPVYCPHQGLPLDGEPDEAGIITCPWHGYRVDAATGRCAPPGQTRR
jgi:nitrite reductase/ring-hydroxylating ferredoxin subunit